MKFCTRVRLKRWKDRGEFQLDRARIKNNIAESSFALGHETHMKRTIDIVISQVWPINWLYSDIIVPNLIGDHAMLMFTYMFSWKRNRRFVYDNYSLY